MGIAADLIYIVLAALAGGLLAHFLKQPLIFGYILAGIAVGPYTGGVTVENVHDIEMLAEIGVALLLFTLGLEFSFGELRRLARITFLGTPVQILLCLAVGYGIALSLGLSKSDAAWIGAAMSLSSTMVVLKTLASRDALDTEPGKIMLAVLIAQDLAVIPLMLLLPQVTGEVIDYGSLVSAGLKSIVFLVFMFFAGTRVLPRLFSLISRSGARELFFISTLAVALGAGFLSHELGLSFALGAFVAGMLLSETDFHHQALSDVSALRDLFALIFFVSVGMLFDPAFFVAHIGSILLLTVAIVASKAVITGGTVRVFKYETVVAWTVGLGLSQVGEFAFVIIKAGSATGHLSRDSFSLMIAVTVLSMVATPGLFWVGDRLARSAARKGGDTPAPPALEATSLANHVIIIGGGVVGQYVARVLSALGRPYVVIEYDHKIVTEMRDRRMNVIFGDGSRHIILEAAGLPQASLVVITTTNDRILPVIISEIKEIRSDVPVVVRVEEIEDVAALSALKVEEIVQPQLEVGLEMVRQSLLALRIDEAQIFTLLGHLRTERYEPNKERSSEELRLMRATRLLEVIWWEVKEGSKLAGRSLLDARLRDTHGVSVVAAIRGEEFIPTPKPDYKMAAGDILGVLGTKTQVESFLGER